MRALSRATWIVGVVAACGNTGPGTPPGDGGGGSGDAGLGGSDAAGLTLAVTPIDPIIDATGSPETLQFTATVGGEPVAATWAVDDVQVGVVNASGLFRAGGQVAGTARVTARYGDDEASTTVRVRVTIVDPGSIDPAVRDLLDAGGTADPTFGWLYPYDRTVFPRGLAAPHQQYAGGAADAMRVQATVGDFTYVGYVGASAPASSTLPADVWDALLSSAGAGQDIAVAATKIVGTAVTGPSLRTWRAAQGDLKGIIYYNSYNSPIAGGGGVLRIRPGGDAELVQSGCTVCHSVSANGGVMVSGVSWGSGNPLDSRSFDLGADGSSTTRTTDVEGKKWSFAALTPDGAWALGNGIPTGGPGIRGLSGGYASRLWDTSTGLEVAAPSFTNQVTYALTPAFSPDGKKLAFNWQQGDGRTLAVMGVDLAQSPPLFGTAATAVQAAGGVLGWPSFLPDSGGVVYQAGNKFDTESGSYAALNLVVLGATPAENLVSTLPALNGRDGAGVSILPGGDAEDNDRNYEATILPIPVGGYYWAMFTSRRTYGHTLGPGGTVANTADEFLENSARKKLWVAAIDLDYATKVAAGVDPSHPALYLPGQELSAGNMRAFAALEPCRDLGASCESGADCCDGFCRPVDYDPSGAPILACVEPPPGCSNVDETCATDGDCCGVLEGATCINNRCATAPPIE